MNLTGVQIGYSISYQNLLLPCFKAKLGWADGLDTNYHNSILGSSVILGLTLGALSGGVIMKIGRRNTLFISLVIGLIGNLLTININSFFMLNIGRLLYGYSSGLYSSVVPKMMGETLPDHVFESIISLYVAAQGIGMLISNLFVFILPTENETELLA